MLAELPTEIVAGTVSPDDPAFISKLLERQISTLGDSLNRQLNTTETNLTRRLDQQDRELQEIRRQTTSTDGRVSDLEKARERSLGVISAFKWAPPVLTACITAGLTILIMALSGGLH